LRGGRRFRGDHRDRLNRPVDRDGSVHGHDRHGQAADDAGQNLESAGVVADETGQLAEQGGRLGDDRQQDGAEGGQGVFRFGGGSLLLAGGGVRFAAELSVGGRRLFHD
jgi:hypothetical protein